MTRTSQTHPLDIAEVVTPEHCGKVGITFCPGKKQPNAATGAWDRDLQLDLDRVADWNAAALVTVAMANKTARIVWAVLARGETYRSPGAI